MAELVLTEQDRYTLKKLFLLFHFRAKDKGFHEMTDQLHDLASDLRDEGKAVLADYVLSTHRGNRLALIADEITEAREEIRKGKVPGEVYTSSSSETSTPKPEGYLSEVVDVFIRLGDTMGEEQIIDQFLDMLETKVNFNNTRSLRNGNKSF